MRIGVDFDNTIVCFDSLFFHEARRQELIPADVNPTKQGVRDYLRSQGKENDWTRLQGVVYGKRIQEAKPFSGAKEFFIQAHAQGHHLWIISHKTKTPALGEPLDLHGAAREWLEANGFDSPLSIDRKRIFFETSIPMKIERIKHEACDIFIDDLPEFLLYPTFPQNVDRILFSPDVVHKNIPFRQATSWNQIQSWII